jgi:general secretion pathway protein E
MAQRLVRVLCPDCKTVSAASEPELQWLGLDTAAAVEICRPNGCEQCKNTGYRGRTGIYELIEVDDALRMMIHAGASEFEMLQEARKHSDGILADGMRRVLAGDTSMEEIMRVSSAA